MDTRIERINTKSMFPNDPNGEEIIHTKFGEDKISPVDLQEV